MALEQDIANLIEASNNLTTIVDNKIQDIDNQVQAKRNEVDTLISTTNIKVDNKLSSLSIIGDGGHGTRAINVAHLFTPEQGATFVHIKLPLKADTNHEMFHLKATGYAYGEVKVVDATLVGYCYKPSDNVININTIGSHSPHLYKGSDGYIYGRLTFTSQYYLTLSIDTMRVGNGRLFKHGDIELIRSDAETL